MNTVDREETFSLFAKAFGDRNSESMFCNNLQNTTKSVQRLKIIDVKCIFIQAAIKFQLKYTCSKFYIKTIYSYPECCPEYVHG